MFYDPDRGILVNIPCKIEKNVISAVGGWSNLCCAVLVTQSCLTVVTPCLSPPGSSVHGTLQARTLEWVAMPSSRGSSQPGIEQRSPTLQVASLPSEPPGKWSPGINYIQLAGVKCSHVLTYFLQDLSLSEKGFLKSPAMIMDSPAFLCKSFCLIIWHTIVKALDSFVVTSKRNNC